MSSWYGGPASRDWQRRKSGLRLSAMRAFNHDLLLRGGALVALACLAMSGNFKSRSAEPTALESITVPSGPDRYFTPEFSLRLTLPRSYLHQKGERWLPPIHQVSFALDTANDGPTAISPIEDPAVVVVTLSVVAHDYIDAGLDSANPRYLPYHYILPGNPVRSQRYGLTYVTNQQYLGAPPEELLFNDGPPYTTRIYCQPSGNAFPSLCTLSVIGPRGAGVKDRAGTAVLTEIIFRHDRLPDWQAIKAHVDHFLNGKTAIVRAGDEHAR